MWNYSYYYYYPQNINFAPGHHLENRRDDIQEGLNKVNCHSVRTHLKLKNSCLMGELESFLGNDDGHNMEKGNRDKGSL